MNYRQARIFLITTIIIAVILIGVMILRPVFRNSGATNKPSEIEPTTEIVKNSRTPANTAIPKVGNLAKQFADLNRTHLYHARKLGIKPIANTRDILKIKRPLVHIKSNDFYQIDRLSHSYPYLVPQAAQLLDTIAQRFHNKLEQRHGAHYKLKVTSLLRTQESVKRLQRRNVNSTSNSAHLYATTFDISHGEFIEQMFNTHKLNNTQLKNILAEVLLELRQEGKCLVKYEHKQRCFHITTTRR